ncbi:hypothetical protein [Streptomyces sp. NPDC053079]|uniref:hypothetical protein n=1 Tax=Streptomyces sp. NPDC053079 TaxID=3365697 RepID=UPI0037D2150A
MPERIYMNRIAGQRRIHIEITEEELADLVGDSWDDPLFEPAKELRRIIEQSALDFSRSPQ